jgi:hypothetical protein
MVHYQIPIRIEKAFGPDPRPHLGSICPTYCYPIDLYYALVDLNVSGSYIYLFGNKLLGYILLPGATIIYNKYVIKMIL